MFDIGDEYYMYSLAIAVWVCRENYSEPSKLEK